MGHEFLGIGWGHTTSVKDTGLPSHCFSGKPNQVGADEGVGFLGLFRGGGEACADCPDRFVGNHDLGDLLGRESLESGLKLLLKNGLFLSGLTFLKGLADTEDGAEFLFQSRLQLPANRLVGLAEEASPLAMPHKDEADEEVS